MSAGRRVYFSKVLYVVTLYGKYTKDMTFENGPGRVSSTTRTWMNRLTSPRACEKRENCCLTSTGVSVCARGRTYTRVRILSAVCCSGCVFVCLCVRASLSLIK